MALRWKDNEGICLMSTVHNSGSSTVKTKGGQEVKKPNVVLDYNHTLTGVDKADPAHSHKRPPINSLFPASYFMF